MLVHTDMQGFTANVLQCCDPPRKDCSELELHEETRLAGSLHKQLWQETASAGGTSWAWQTLANGQQRNIRGLEANGQQNNIRGLEAYPARSRRLVPPISAGRGLSSVQTAGCGGRVPPGSCLRGCIPPARGCICIELPRGGIRTWGSIPPARRCVHCNPARSSICVPVRHTCLLPACPCSLSEPRC